MPDEQPSRLIAAIWDAHEAVMHAQRAAARAGDTEALETLSIAREWLRITLRRHGENTIRED